MSLFSTPPDSYWEPPEPTFASVWEDANQDADSLVAEWADQGEYEVFIEVNINGGKEPVFELRRVARDGDALYQNARGSHGLEFDSIEELREHMEKEYPFPD